MELHDNIAQIISLAVMSLGALKDDYKSQDIIKVQNFLCKALKDLRYLIKTIKLRETSDFDLDLQIQELLEILNQTSNIDFLKSGKTPSMDNERKYLLLRIMQELLNNILKYSKAQKVEIIFNTSEVNTFLKIIHDGETFRPSKEDFKRGYGLINIYENTKFLNGTIDYETGAYNIQLKFPNVLPRKNKKTEMPDN